MQKSKLLALLLAVAMVVSMIVAPAYAVVNDTTCECGETVEWTTWDGTVADGGHYKLPEGGASIGAAITISGKVCIDLAGQTLSITAKSARFIVEEGATLSIMDSQGDGKLTYTGGDNKNKDGGLVSIDGGSFNLYSGTLSNGKVSSYYDGGNIYAKGGVVNLLGGEVTGGKAMSGSGTDGRDGGNIYLISGAELNIYAGAKITNGKTYDSDSGNGGNVYANASTINMYGGEISGGNAVGVGGNIYTTGACAINMYGGEIKGGVATKNSGNIIVAAGTTFNMYGGSVIEGSVGEGGYAPGVRVNRAGSGKAQGELYVYGGTIDSVYDGSDAYVTNNIIKAYNGVITMEPKVEGAEGDVTLQGVSCACRSKEGTTYTVWNPGHIEGTCTVEDCPYEAALAADAANDKYTITQVQGQHNFENGICSSCGAAEPVVETPTDGACDHCGEEDQTWNLWTADTDLADVAAGGHWRLDESFQLTAMIEPTADLCVDLNGHTLTTKGGTNDDNGRKENIFTVSTTTLSVMDSSEDESGKLQGGAGSTKKIHGAVVRAEGEGVFYLYSGTITGGKTTSAYDGANVGAIEGGTVNLLGGTVSNGSARYGGNIIARGGNIYIDGCTIIGGTASSGGDSIYLTTSNDTVSSLTIVSGSIGAGTTDERDVQRGNSSQIVKVYAGVEFKEMITRDFLDCVAGAWNGETYKTFDDLAQADAFATAEGNLYLGNDHTITGDFEITAGQLVLCGNTLTVEDGVLDLSATNVPSEEGFIEAERVIFGNENSALPITVNGVTQMEKKPAATIKASKDNETSEVKKFAFYFSTLAEKTLLDDAILEEGNDLTVQIKVSVDGEEVGTYNLANEAGSVLDEFAGAWDTKALVISVSGAEGEVSIEVIVSANGVTA